MTTVYFVRHAEPNYNNHDDATRELSSKGLQDRQLVTQFFMDKDINVIVSSPYKRAYDTISPMAENKGIAIQVIDGFKERRVDSVWVEDFHAFSKQQWADFNYKLSDGECLQEVQDRNIRALKELVQDNLGKEIVVGSHGTALSTIINYYNPAFGFEDFQKIKKLMPWIVRFEFEGDICISIKEYNLFED